MTQTTSNIPTKPVARKAWLAELEQIAARIRDCCQCDGCKMGRSRLAVAQHAMIALIREQTAEIERLRGQLADYVPLTTKGEQFTSPSAGQLLWKESGEVVKGASDASQ